MTDVIVTADESVIRPDGSVVHFSLERFRRDIVMGDCCFMCGASPGSKAFNGEHVIPDWLLGEFDLHDKSVTLPNGSRCRYSRYLVPCCVDCNSQLGKNVETPISEIIKGGYDRVVHALQNEGPLRLFAWVNLIFLKTHLRDRSLRFNLDTRWGTEKIADYYDWSTMHHIHCVARAYRTGAAIDQRIIGSVFVLRAKQGADLGQFDYGDLFTAKLAFIQLREIALFCVLDDACGAFTLLKDGLMQKIKGPLSPIQLREIMARIAYANSLVTPRPVFHTDILAGVPRISVTLPDTVVPAGGDPERFGALMHFLCAPLLESYRGENKDFILENLRRGRWSFVFDSAGKFVADSMDPT